MASSLEIILPSDEEEEVEELNDFLFLKSCTTKRDRKWKMIRDLTQV